MEDEKSLHDSIASGQNVQTLKDLLEKDPSLIRRVSYTSPNQIPLHVATMLGHHDFVKEILNRNDSMFAKQLAGQQDSQKSSALHLASTLGDLVTVELFSRAAPDSCFMRDCEGRNPLHLAAVKGHVPVLKHLVKVARGASREKVDGGLSLLHLCVKHNQLEALKVLLPDLNQTPSVPVLNGVINATAGDGETVLHLAGRENQTESLHETPVVSAVLNGMINATDDDGETVLHLAVRENQLEAITYLVEAEADVNVENSKGQMALDILEPKGPHSDAIRDILKPRTSHKTRPERWLTQKRDAIMVVAILIATMAFQAGVTPPGGVWQDDQRDNPNFPHRAGEAVIASIHPKSYRNFLRCNTVALVSSLSTILLLISGLPFKRRPFMWILMVIMWLTVTSIAGTYGISIFVVTPENQYKSLFYVMGIAVGVWSGVLGILMIWNSFRLIDSKLKNRGRELLQPRRFIGHVRSSLSYGQGNV